MLLAEVGETEVCRPVRSALVAGLSSFLDDTGTDVSVLDPGYQ